ncbi:putative membrane protein, partial [Yersinia pestis PY-10]
MSRDFFVLLPVSFFLPLAFK